MTEEREVQEARQLSVAAPILLPMLERDREGAVQKIIANFLSKEHDKQVESIAELVTIDNLLCEIKAKLGSLNGKGE